MFYLLLLLIKDGRGRKERLRETPRPARYTLDKPFSWRGRLWVSGSVQQLPTAAQDLRGQSAPWHADFNRRGLAKPDQGGKQEANGGKLAFLRAVQAFTCHGAAVPTSSLSQLTFTSHTGSLLLSLYAPRYCLTASAGFGRQFTKLRALSRLRRRYDSRK